MPNHTALRRMLGIPTHSWPFCDNASQKSFELIELELKVGELVKAFFHYSLSVSSLVQTV